MSTEPFKFKPRRKRTDRLFWQAKYEEWWLNKRCHVVGDLMNEFKLVVKIELTGPPSFVYGMATLIFEDGSNRNIATSSAFRPRKCDVEVETVELHSLTLARTAEQQAEIESGVHCTKKRWVKPRLTFKPASLGNCEHSTKRDAVLGGDYCVKCLAHFP
jgi:hypothetical protein